jgi:Cd2+/Zn2+-exporting ATPase
MHAPALARADVGVAMGSDVALETADIALIQDRLDRVPYAIDLSRATMRRIRENITLSIVVKFGVALLALTGFVTLWVVVAVGDMGLSLAVILNALRLGRIRPERA